MALYGIAANGAADDGRVVIIKTPDDGMVFEHDSPSAGANEGFRLPDYEDFEVKQADVNVAFRYLWDDSGPEGWWELLWHGAPAPAQWQAGNVEYGNLGFEIDPDADTFIFIGGEPG